MSFGFSAGDFVAALQLVGQVISALRDSGGSGAEYRELVGELYGLEKALLAVNQLETVDQEQHVEYMALRHVAAQCQQTIDAFCVKINKYHVPFQRVRQHSSAKMKLGAAVLKIQWSLCMKDDLARFKTDVAAHAQSLQILLSAAQVRQARVQAQNSDLRYRSITASIQSGTGQILEKIGTFTEVISEGALQSKFFVQRTAEIIRFNVFVFQMLCLIYATILKLPQQVDREKPVVLFDALGRTAPFHLEFVRSFDAFKAVLIANFRDVPSGIRKIKNEEFIIQDAATKRAISLRSSWDRCLSPGQRVEMSIVFRWKSRRAFQCPNCSAPANATYNQDVECASCGVIFGSFIEVGESRQKASVDQHVAFTDALSSIANGNEAKSDTQKRQKRILPKSAYDETEDYIHYRRVKMIRRISKKTWNSLLQGSQQQRHHEIPIIRPPSPPQSQMNDRTNEPEGLEEGEIIDADLADPATFSQILEMDEDDDIGREFSKSIVAGLFTQGKDYIEIFKAAM
ncbi:hypothetical protein GGR57DRAFT_467543 [Xylariaceae sp. FL1272]|nr:hypothetical protein GGR57DRAFT_467543 [Xylariaceae sp. FL1272]